MSAEQSKLSFDEPQADPCESCGISKLAKHEESCFACGSSERVAARMLLLLAVL